MSDTFTIGVTTIANDLRLPPQARVILGHLLKGKDITPLKAFSVYHVRNIADCVMRIKRAGYDVTTERRVDEVGGRYVSYRLAPKVKAN
jgi:hypothetical protein